MSEPWEDIAKRLAAHPRFEWREGMMATDHVGNVPDLTDAATTGILLLGMLDEALGGVSGEYGASLGRGLGAESHLWDASIGGESNMHEVPGAACALALLEAWGTP